jgi:hypothetical protein
MSCCDVQESIKPGDASEVIVAMSFVFMASEYFDPK